MEVEPRTVEEVQRILRAAEVCGRRGGLRIAEVLVCVGRQWRVDRIDIVEVGGEPALVCHREATSAPSTRSQSPMAGSAPTGGSSTHG
jgi:hypothetical protein